MSSHPISGLLRKEGAGSGGTGHHSGGGGSGSHCDVGNGDGSGVRGDRENNHGASSSNVGVGALDVRVIRVDPLLTPTSLSAPNGPIPTTNPHPNASASPKHAAASSLTMNGETGMVLGLNCTALMALQHICQ